MMRFIETLYADPLLKFLVDTTMKSFVIFAVAGLFAFRLRRKSAAMRGFVWRHGTRRMPHYPAVFACAPEVGTRYPTGNIRLDGTEPIVNRVGVVYTHHTDTAATRSRD